MLHDIEITHGSDGYWLNFKTDNGKHASISLNAVTNFRDRGVIRDAVMQWAAAQTGGQPMYVPSIGDVIELRKPWTAHIEDESRNRKYLLSINAIEPFSRTYGAYPVSFAMGTKLKIERIYIRQNASGYDSVTVRVVGQKNSRFWVKLANFNELVFEKES